MTDLNRRMSTKLGIGMVSISMLGLHNALTHSWTHNTHLPTHRHISTLAQTCVYSLRTIHYQSMVMLRFLCRSEKFSAPQFLILFSPFFYQGFICQEVFRPPWKAPFFLLFAVHPSPHPSLWVSSRSLRPEDVRSRSLLNRASVTRRQAENDVLTWPGSVSKGNAGDSVTSRGQGYSAPLLNRRGQIKETVWTRHRLHHKDIIPR